MKIAFIVKGLIKNKNVLFKKIENLKKEISEVDIYETKHQAHAIELAKIASENDYTHIIAVGGDGTLNEVVNGVILSGKNNLPVVGCLPFGTANDFIKTAKLNGSFEELAQLLKINSHKKIDVGKVSFNDQNGNPAEKYFANIGDIGIGGYIVEKMNRKFWGGLAYYIETMKAMLLYNRSKVRCVCKEFQWEGKTLSMIMANAKYFASGLCIAPDADLHDEKFSIVVLGDVTIIDYLKNLSKVRRGEKLSHPEIFYKETNEIEITPLEDKCPIDLDGEFIGYAPAKFTILPAKIDFLMK